MAVQHVTSILLRLLIRLLPKEERRSVRRRLAICGLVILVLVGAFIGVQWIGPAVDGPSEDPVECLNRARAGIQPNAADVYLAAIQARGPAPVEAWPSLAERSRTPLSAELAAWLKENAESIDLTRQASRMHGCHFHLERLPSGMLQISGLRELRARARFIGLRVRLAAERRDLDSLVDSLLMLTGFARHVSRCPGLLGDLHGMAFRALGMEHFLLPYEWPELSARARRTYAPGGRRPGALAGPGIRVGAGAR